MSTRYEYSLWQWWFHWLRDSYRYPLCDVPIGTRTNLDRTEVTSTAIPDWKADSRTAKIASDTVHLPRPFRKRQGWGGRPMQLGNPDRKISVRVLNREYGLDYRAVVNRPMSNQLWTEGNPAPNLVLRGSNHDAHLIVVNPDGSSWEAIGAYVSGSSVTVARLARLDPDGNLTHEDEGDRTVTWGKEPITRHMLRRGEDGHRLSLTVRGNDKDTPHFPWHRQWLALDPKKAPTGLPHLDQMVVDQLVTHGVLVLDHGGITSVVEADGADWNNTKLHTLGLKLNDFLIAS